MQRLTALHYIVAAIIIFSLGVIFCGLAQAQDASYDTGSGIQQQRDKMEQQKKTEEERDSKGRRIQDSKSYGGDEQLQRALRDVEQAQKSKSTEISLDLDALFLAELTRMEAASDWPEKPLTRPLLPGDVGLGAEIRPGVFDVNRQALIKQAAEASLPLSRIGDEAKVVSYMHRLADYGAWIGQAYLYLLQDIGSIGGVKKESANMSTINSLGHEDLVKLANAALRKAMEGGISNPTIRSLHATTRLPVPCRLDGDRERIVCGNVHLALSARPQLHVSGIPFYGPKYAGYQGTIKVNHGWSLSKAIEELDSTSTYKRWAKEVNTFAEHLESQGRAREAAMVRKAAWDRARKMQAAVSPSRLLPGIN